MTRSAGRLRCNASTWAPSLAGSTSWLSDSCRSHGRIALFALVLLATPAQSARSQTLQIPGSGPPEAALRSLAAEFERANSGVKIVVPPSTGIAGALRAVHSGTSPIARIGRPLNEGEIKQGVKQYVYATDAVVFTVGANVTLRNLKSDQVLAIFAGRIDNWSMLGAQPGPVRVFYREPTEGNHRELKRHIPGFGELVFPPTAKLLNSDTEMVEGLSQYPTAIGWLTLSTVRSAGAKMHAVSYDGIAPTVENLRAGHYKMAARHIMIYREQQLTPVARRFLGYLATDEAGAVLARLGTIHHKP